MAEAEEGVYDLIVTGDESHHQIFPPRKIGSTTSKLSHRLETPLLIARNLPEKINQILICTSAEPVASATLTQGGQIVAFSQAPVTILHVMSQISLSQNGTTDDLLMSAETAIQHQTREGNYLINAIHQIQAAGVTAAITPRLRHGLVMDEVFAEIKEYGVDILVIGSHHQPGQSWLVEHLLEDVARDLLQDAPCSVLVV